jgi:hypothetical protein
MKEEISDLTGRIVKLHQEFEEPGSTDLPRYLAASDLHGNHARLKEILATAERERVAQVFLVGDLYFGTGGWTLYRMLRALVDNPLRSRRVIPLWGNHELAFVAGMLGNDSQLKFFFGFGGQELIQEMNAELEEHGQAAVSAGERESPTAADLAEMRSHSQLREMAQWIQKTHRIIASDTYGTGYLHACPRIARNGRLELQYRTCLGLEALRLMESDLAQVETAKHPVFSVLLQTDISPLWGMFEMTSAKQFDGAFHPLGIRQLVFGHRHRAHPINIARANRQIGIAVDFEEGLGGYLLVGADGLVFRSFSEQNSQRTEETQLVVPAGQLTAAQTHLQDVEEFFVRRLVEAQKSLFATLPAMSRKNRSEFKQLEWLRRQGFTWIHRLYAELYPHVKDLVLRKEMFAVVVESCDEEAFKSLIHLLYEKTRELQGHGGDWYNEQYVQAKSLVQVLLTALRDMPLRRLGLLDVSLRGTTSRINLLELYHKIMELQDPDLALMAVGNLGALESWAADQELRRAFFHDVRKVRVEAAQVLANRGEVVYPLVKTLVRSPDNWVRFLAIWTIGKLGERGVGMDRQAIQDIRTAISHEPDWLIYVSGKEVLRKLGDPQIAELPDRTKIPNLTEEIVETLQCIVAAEQEPFRKSFKVYFITVVISSLVYRRGLVGLDLDELKIYVNSPDYFPPHYRFYKSATRDEQGRWLGWRRLWIRGETFNRPDGPEIIRLAKSDADKDPAAGPQTIVLYDHRHSNGRVELPDLDAVIAKFGTGKAKDRVRDAFLRDWPSFTHEQQQLMIRLHAAAAVKMLFDLPAEVFVNEDELRILGALATSPPPEMTPIPKPLLTLEPTVDRLLQTRVAGRNTLASPNWLDAIKYAVRVWLLDK